MHPDLSTCIDTMHRIMRDIRLMERQLEEWRMKAIDAEAAYKLALAKAEAHKDDGVTVGEAKARATMATMKEWRAYMEADTRVRILRDKVDIRNRELEVLRSELTTTRDEINRLQGTPREAMSA